MRPKLTVIDGGKTDDEPVELIDPKSNGGTEIQARRLFSELPDLCEQFDWVLSYPKKPINPKRPTILWMHETPFDRGIQTQFKDPNYWKQFVKIVFVSYWQQQMFHVMYGVPYEISMVVQNAIDPIQIEEKPLGQPIKLIYASTPHRGLDILLDVVENDLNDFNWELDVFSSFKLYNRPSNDIQYQKLFDRCDNNDRINYYGNRPNEEVRKAMINSHVLAYPNTYLETSCIVAMEAMSAKNLIVCPQFGALPETTGQFAWTYNMEHDKSRHRYLFSHLLKNVLMTYENIDCQNMIGLQKVYADTFYNWQIRLQLWQQLLEGLSAMIQPPTGRAS